MALFELTELASWVQSDVDTATATLCHDQALAYLEGEVGVKLSQAAGVTVEYHPRWDDALIDLPIPTTSVTSVSVDGSALDASDYQVLDHRLYRSVGWGGSRWGSSTRFAYPSSDDEYVSVEVTMTYGFATAPADFKTYGLILAGQAYQLMPKLNLQSVRLDDYAESFATNGALVAAGMGLPDEVLGRLKSRYGRRTAVVVESR